MLSYYRQTNKQTPPKTINTSLAGDKQSTNVGKHIST